MNTGRVLAWLLALSVIGLAEDSTAADLPPVQPVPAAAPAGGVHGFIAGGVATTPDYEGSSDYSIVPFLSGQVNYHGYSLTVAGPSARLNVIPGSWLEAGPVVAYSMGRDDSVENDAVARLHEVDASVEAGAFVEASFNAVLLPGDRVELGFQFLQDLGDGHGGFVAELKAGYGMAITEKLFVGMETALTFASDDYMESFFGITALDSIASGLSQFSPSAGIKDVEVGLNARYALTEHWSVNGRASYIRLLGDAADSPVVDQEGSADQFRGGLGLGYRF